MATVRTKIFITVAASNFHSYITLFILTGASIKKGHILSFISTVFVPAGNSYCQPPALEEVFIFFGFITGYEVSSSLIGLQQNY